METLYFGKQLHQTLFVSQLETLRQHYQHVWEQGGTMSHSSACVA